MILFTSFDQWNSTTDPVLGANHYPPWCLAASNACNMFWSDTSSPENSLLPYLVKGVLLWTCFGSIQNDLLSFIINEKNYLNENKKGKHVKGEIGCCVLKLQKHVNVMMVQGCDKKCFLNIFFLLLLNIFCCFKWVLFKGKVLSMRSFSQRHIQ